MGRVAICAVPRAMQIRHVQRPRSMACCPGRGVSAEDEVALAQHGKLRVFEAQRVAASEVEQDVVSAVDHLRHAEQLIEIRHSKRAA